MPTNAYSPDWFSTFLPPTSTPTVAELEFVERHFPPSKFPRLLDVGCGVGRHANALAARGYAVLGADRNLRAIESARSVGQAGARFLCMDIRDLDRLTESFDGALSLWASFGHFDTDTNQSILSGIGARLRTGGRILMDVYNRDGLTSLPARETIDRGGREITIERFLSGQRFRVTLTYADTGAREDFEWDTYSPSDLAALAVRCGFMVVCECAWFNEAVPPAAEHARMQVVLERSSAGSSKP